jgi:hypothetical protein
MNTKFTLKENKLIMTVTLPKRRTVSDKRVRVGCKTACELVKEYKCPANVKVLDCLTPASSADNGYDHKVVGVWEFSIEKEKPTAKRAKRVQKPKSEKPTPGRYSSRRSSKKVKKEE